ncbi:hypothetical protein HUG10_12565 [Halorarum halophilum]|uniref:Uncharacterized protein n=1 Tax=Halorarum halophilum TaxID=2743090 RepID=A0A7D5GCL3_9EURY|nr:hypothetical protein [Halobaculum halophilum]QLG28326.1 hypothetical protein HUG10_12565 [Halobaculum halophilum]
MFQCLCDTCEERELIEELEQAQEYFNEHADRGCEVEIINVELAADQLNTGPTQPASCTEEPRTANEISSREGQQSADR